MRPGREVCHLGYVEEVELTGGRITAGVVRVGDTVRRPRNSRADWIDQVLAYLEDADYPHAPRFLGIDGQGRDILTLVPGETTDHPSQRQPGAYRLGGRMLRSLHAATLGHRLINEWPGARCDDAVCVLHGDPGAYNTIFQDGLPVALIDWDAAHPGNPVDDLAYMTWTWCIQSSGNVPVTDQANHVRELAEGYDTSTIQITAGDLLDHVLRVQQNLIDVEQKVLSHPGTTTKRAAHAETAMAWAASDREFLQCHRSQFDAALS